MKCILLLLCLFHPLSSMAKIQAQKGDIVVFNTPLEKEVIKVQLFQCVASKKPCESWEPLARTSPLLKQGEYYTLVLSDKDKVNLSGHAISIKVYRVSDKKWSERLSFIEQFDSNESPFYQYMCLTRKESGARCVSSDNVRLKKDSLWGEANYRFIRQYVV